MWNICILLVKCSFEKVPLPLNQTDMPIINNRNMSSERIEKCNVFKNSVLDIPRHPFYPGFHEKVQLNQSEKKGYHATITENKDAFEILGVEEPITYIIFDPEEYEWRRLPSSFERYAL
jgi:hypothetical protein